MSGKNVESIKYSPYFKPEVGTLSAVTHQFALNSEEQKVRAEYLQSRINVVRSHLLRFFENYGVKTIVGQEPLCSKQNEAVLTVRLGNQNQQAIMVLIVGLHQDHRSHEPEVIHGMKATIQVFDQTMNAYKGAVFETDFRLGEFEWYLFSRAKPSGLFSGFVLGQPHVNKIIADAYPIPPDTSQPDAGDELLVLHHELMRLRRARDVERVLLDLLHAAESLDFLKGVSRKLSIIVDDMLHVRSNEGQFLFAVQAFYLKWEDKKWAKSSTGQEELFYIPYIYSKKDGKLIPIKEYISTRGSSYANWKELWKHVQSHISDNHIEDEGDEGDDPHPVGGL